MPGVRFRDVLARELDRRRGRNPRYSLRRFAVRLGVHHATLSRVLRGTKPIAERTVRALGGRIGISAAELEMLVETENAALVLLVIGRPAFRPSSRWLATVAGISVDRVNIALQELLRTGSLNMVARDRWTVGAGVQNE
jgi:transcriptional regulator with XRE-family HTH domain